MRKHGDGFPFVIMLNALSCDSMEFTSSGPCGEKSEEERLPDHKLWNRQFEGFKGVSGEGHEDQGKIPLKKNPGCLWALPRGGEQKGEQGHGCLKR